MSKSVSLSCEEAKRIVAELSVVVVSLDQMGSYYASKNNLERLDEEVGKFIVERRIAPRLAKLRKLIDEKLDGILDEREQEEFNEECEKLNYWEGPSL